MFGPCPVVRIEYDNADGFTEINESDFNPKKHKLYDPVKPKKDADLPVDKQEADKANK